MSSIPLRLGVHVGDTKRGETLGVAHFAANMITALQGREDVELVVIGDPAATAGYGVDATADPATGVPVRVDAVVQIHQFLEQVVDVPTVAIVHDLHLFTVGWKYAAGADRLRRLFEANIRAGAVASEFPGTIESIAERFPSVADNCRLLSSPTLLSDHPLTPDARARVRQNLTGGGPPTVLYPAQLQEHKNHWNLMAAVALLRDRGTPVRVICTGSTFQEHLTSSLTNRAAELGLTDLVRFPGFVSGSDLRALYAEVDAVISPSLAEGGAYIAQEAIVHARPVACSDLSSVRAHLARLEVEVPLFDPFDIEAVASSLMALVDRGGEIVAGYGRALERESEWTWDVVASEIVDLARSVGDGSIGGDR